MTIGPDDKTVQIPEGQGPQEDDFPDFGDIPEQIGDFSIIRELGQGGMGVVYEAKSERLGTNVALKVIAENAKDYETQRFQIEARAAARLRHEHIVRVLEHHQTREGRHYLAMQLIEGEALDEAIEAEGPLEPGEVLRMGIELADALAYAHESSVLHRDIKPSNVLLDRERRAYLTDFGLAKVLDSSTYSLTNTGDLVGTPCYMSPEQARGDRHRVGPPTDVYGLGATLYHALTGALPYSGSSITEIVLRIVSHDPEPIRNLAPNVPPELERIVLRCMAREPSQRFASAGELASELRRLRRKLEPAPQRPATRRFEGPADEPLTPAADPAAAPAPAQPAEQIGLKLAAVVLLAGIVAGLAYDLLRSDSSGPAPVASPTASSVPVEQPQGAPAWLAWRAAQRDTRLPRVIPFAHSLSEGLEEARVRNVPLVVVMIDSVLGALPPFMHEASTVRTLTNDAVVVALTRGTHAEQGQACPVFGSIRCATHQRIADEAPRVLPSLVVPSGSNPFPPSLTFVDPRSQPPGLLSQGTMRHEDESTSSGIRALALHQQTLGAPRIGCADLDLLARPLEQLSDLSALVAASQLAGKHLTLAEPIGSYLKTRVVRLAEQSARKLESAPAAQRAALLKQLREALAAAPEALAKLPSE